MLTCYLLTEPTLVVDHLYDLSPVVAKLVLVFSDTDTVGRPRVSSHGCQTNRLPGHNLYVRRQISQRQRQGRDVMESPIKSNLQILSF